MEIMSDDMVSLFETMIGRSDFESMSGISDKIPPPSLINEIIFKILMVNCTESVANEADAYLSNYLLLLPPKSKGFHYNYRETLLDKSGNFEDIWSVFSHLIKSCFSHYNISQKNKRPGPSELVIHPNCNILIDFYVNMITKFLSIENDLFEDNSEERFSMLLLWINKLYKIEDQWIPILDTLHILLDKKVVEDIAYDTSEMKFEYIINVIMDECPNVFNNVENMKFFFTKSDLPHFQSRICQHKLYELIYKKKLQKKKHTPLTLKILIYNYFFKFSSKKHTRKKHQTLPQKKDPATSSKHPKKIFFKQKMGGDTNLHEFCRDNRPGDLFEVLSSSSELKPNARNSAGYTALHVACLAKSYHCTKFLLEELMDKDEKIDLQATDNNGLTPLHCAAYVDSLEIVKLLLKHGGTQLVNIEDNFSKKAVDYTKSQKLEKELNDIESSIKESTSSKLSTTSGESLAEPNMDLLTVPIMNNKEEYSSFLYGLHSILSHYLNAFGILNSKNEIVKHSKSKCPHYVSTTNSAICDEDASILANLPQLLDHFFSCIQANAKNINVEIRTDLLLLLSLRKMLDSCIQMVYIKNLI